MSAPVAEPPAVQVPADVLELAAKLRRAGALQVLVVTGGLGVRTDAGQEQDLQVARWLLVAVPLGRDELTDGRMVEI